MTKRKIRLAAVIVVLTLSLVLLAWGLLPFQHAIHTLSFPAGSLQVP